MSLPFSLTVEHGLLGLMAVVVIVCLFKMRSLQRALKEEKNKRIIPLIMLEFNHDSSEIYLKNDGHCSARNIKIQDLEFLVDYGFKKRIVLKFDPVDFLNPNKTADLRFQPYDGEHALPSLHASSLFAQFATGSFELSVTYTNIENVLFSEVIVKDNDKLYIKEVVPQAQDSFQGKKTDT